MELPLQTGFRMGEENGYTKKNEIWNYRCKLVSEWEKKTGIQRKMKYEKRKGPIKKARRSQKGKETANAESRNDSPRPLSKQEEWKKSFEIAMKETFMWLMEGVTASWCRK